MLGASVVKTCPDLPDTGAEAPRVTGEGTRVGVETLFDTAADSPRVTVAKGRVVFGAAEGVGEAVVGSTRGAVAPTVLVKIWVGTVDVTSLP